jgi:hypothetical protein
MTPAWAQRREELLSDCLVSPDVFHQMLDRLGEFVVPYQRALESEAVHRPMHLYLQGLLSPLVDVERQVIQDFIGIAPWNHQPLVTVLVGEVAEQLGGLCRKYCSGGHAGAVAPVWVGIKQPGSRTIRPQ